MSSKLAVATAATVFPAHLRMSERFNPDYQPRNNTNKTNSSVPEREIPSHAKLERRYETRLHKSPEVLKASCSAERSNFHMTCQRPGRWFAQESNMATTSPGVEAAVRRPCLGIWEGGKMAQRDLSELRRTTRAGHGQMPQGPFLSVSGGIW